MTATKQNGGGGKRTPHGLVNPAIVRLLGSPLHFVLSGGTLILCVTGRKSGRRYEVPLNWIPSADGGLVVFTGKGWSGWWKNVGMEATPVAVTLRGEELPATARRVEDAGAVERGLRAFLARFPSNAKPFSVALEAGKLPRDRDLAATAREGGAVMVEVALDRPEPVTVGGGGR